MQILLLIFDIMGTLSFAVSGALVGIKRKMDIFGVTVLAIVTATGGGILRDIIVGHLPPQAFLNPCYVALSAAAGLVCFLVMCFHPRLPDKTELPLLLLRDMVTIFFLWSFWGLSQA